LKQPHPALPFAKGEGLGGVLKINQQLHLDSKLIKLILLRKFRTSWTIMVANKFRS